MSAQMQAVQMTAPQFGNKFVSQLVEIPRMEPGLKLEEMEGSNTLKDLQLVKLTDKDVQQEGNDLRVIATLIDPSGRKHKAVGSVLCLPFKDVMAIHADTVVKKARSRLLCSGVECLLRHEGFMHEVVKKEDKEGNVTAQVIFTHRNGLAVWFEMSLEDLPENMPVPTWVRQIKRKHSGKTAREHAK